MEKYLIYEKERKTVIFDTLNLNWKRMSQEYFDKNRDSLMKNDTSEETIRAENRIKMVYLSLTQKCNLSCEFCCSKSNPFVDTSNELKYDDILSKLLPSLKAWNPKNIIVSGGEPLTRKDIFEILEILKDKLPESSIMLQTNGLLLTTQIIKRIKPFISYIEISVEEMFEEQKYFDKLSDIFAMIRAEQIPMQFSFVLNRDNAKYIENVMRLMDQYNTPILLRYVSPVGNGVTGNIAFMYQDDIKQLYVKMIDAIIRNHYENPHILELVLKHLQVTESCGAYGKMIYINASGEISLCSGLEFPPFQAGNVAQIPPDSSTQKIRTILENSKVQNRLLVDRIPKCKDCEIKYFCSGTCATKSYNTADPDILYADCAIKKILVYFWLFDYSQNKSVYENLETLRERIVNEYDNYTF